VGDRFEVTATVTAANDAKILGPAADSLGPFLMVDQRTKTKARRGYNETIYRITLAGFKPGSFRLPGFAFLVVRGDSVDTLRTDTATVIISSVLPAKMQDIHDIKPAEAFPNYWLLIIPGAALALAGLGWLGHRLYKKYRKFREQLSAPLPPWEEALLALERLPYREWLSQGKVQKYYYALSEILKRYIERRYEFNAAEQTSTEIIAEMKQLKTPFREEFVDFIRRADMVKYAKYLPTAEEQPAAIEAVRGMVIRSRPIDVATGRGAEAS
jgi:hypothetical protein